MATYNASKVATMALERLGVVAAGQAPDAYAQQKAEEGVRIARDELGHRDLAPWPEEQIPVAVARALSLYVAGEIATDLVSDDRAALFIAQMDEAKRRIASVVGKRRHDKKPTVFEDF